MNAGVGKAITSGTPIQISSVKPNIIRSADIDGNYRYALRRIWSSGQTLIVIGLNPSTADELKDDNTIRLLTNYAMRLKFGGLLMLNLFAWRATRPSDLFKAAKSHDVIGPNNSFEHLKSRIIQSDAPYVFAAWSKHGKNRGHEFARYMGVEWCMHNLKAFAINKDGSPHHPLYLKLHDAIHPYTLDERIFYIP